MGAAAERRDDVRSTGRGPLNWRRGVLMAWGRDDKVGGANPGGSGRGAELGYRDARCYR